MSNFGFGYGDSPNQKLREYFGQIEVVQSLLTKAGYALTDVPDADDFLQTLIEQSKDANLGVYGQRTQEALHNSREMVLATLKGENLLRPLLNAAKTDETISAFLVSVIRSYFLVKGIVEDNEVEVVKALILGANQRARCRYQGTLYTPIVAAAQTGNIRILQRLMEYGDGVDVNQAQSNSETALANAAQQGDIAMMSYLLDNGANPNLTTPVGTALAVSDNLAAVMLLGASGADPNTPDKDGDLPIIGFIDQGRYEIVNALVKMGSDLHYKNKRGKTPIDRANDSKSSIRKEMIGIVVDGNDYAPKNNVSIPEEFARTLEQRIGKLQNLEYPLDLYQEDPEGYNTGSASSASKISWGKNGVLVKNALQATRDGNLGNANDIFIMAFRDVDIPASGRVLDWLKVLLLAKNYQDAYLVLRYYHAISASYNLLRPNQWTTGNGRIAPAECFQTLELNPIEVFDVTFGAWPFNRQDVESRIASFNAGTFVKRYTMSDNDYDTFLRYLVIENYDGLDDDNEAEQSSLDASSMNEKKLLEARVRSGVVEAYAALARLICEEDRQRAIELCEEAVAKGDKNDGPFFLAWMLSDSNPKRSEELYQKCVDAGFCYGAANNLANLIKGKDPKRAAELFQKAIDDGNTKLATKNLADLIRDNDPEQAINLYGQAIDAGNLDACVPLARMIYEQDKDEAIELCEMAVDEGDTRDGAFFLAYLLEDSEPERSKELYQTCIDAGFIWGAARNLGNLVREEDPKRATELFETALQAGNTAVRVPLARLICDEDRDRAIQLCEEAVADGDTDDGAYFLGWLLSDSDVERSKELYQIHIDVHGYDTAANNLASEIEDEDPERAADLYQKAIDNGYTFYAAKNLANLIEDDDPERAAGLYEMAIGAGNKSARVPLAKLVRDTDKQRAIQLCEEATTDGDVDGTFLLALLLDDTDTQRTKELYQKCIDAGSVYAAGNNLANIIKFDEPEHAKELYRLSIEAGNTIIATSNLAHMLFFDNPEEAESLYRISIDHEEADESTLAHIGLSLLIESKDSDEAARLLETAKQRKDYTSSVEYLVDFYQHINPSQADRLRSLLQMTETSAQDKPQAESPITQQRTQLLNAFAYRLMNSAKLCGMDGVTYSITSVEMEAYGLNMDGGDSFIKTYGIGLGDIEGFELAKDCIDDPQVLGNAIYSYWRYWNHWASDSMDDKAVHWFELAARRLGQLTF